jgi:hypothetical protein
LLTVHCSLFIETYIGKLFELILVPPVDESPFVIVLPAKPAKPAKGGSLPT